MGGGKGEGIDGSIGGCIRAWYGYGGIGGCIGT